jgi:hypothetical protein
MLFSTSPVIGTIAFEPYGGACPTLLAHGSDDSSLEALLTSLVRGPLAPGYCGGEPARFVASGRLSRFGFGSDEGGDIVRADVSRLVDELEDEYQRLVMA